MMKNKITFTYPLFKLVFFFHAASGIEEETLQSLLQEAGEEFDMPGLRAAVRHANGSIVRASVGLADQEAGIPLDNSGHGSNCGSN